MHFSDTHLGNREYMMDEREQDFYDSFRECLDMAREERVDFVVHSGDMFDTWGPSNRALSELRDGMRVLQEKGIPMYMVMGDHDRPRRIDYPAVRIFDFLGLKLLGVEDLETHMFNDNTLIAGVSNLKGSRKDRLEEIYSRADTMARDSKNSVMISHQGVEGFSHPEDVQVRQSQLPKNFSYLAFGHIHVSAFRKFPYPFAYAGSTEITSSSEVEDFLSNGKSVNIVDLENGEIEFRKERISSARVQFRINTDLEHFGSEIEARLERYSDLITDKKPLVLSEIHETSDFPGVRKIMERYSDRLMFRRPVLIKESAPETINMDKTERRSIFQEYFRNDERMTQLAMDIYSLIGSMDNESTMSEIEKRALKEVMLDADNKG